MLPSRATGRSSASRARRGILVRWLLTHRAGLLGPRPSADPGRGPGLGPGHRGHRGPGSPLATRDRPRLPHHHLRLARRRGHPPHQLASPSVRSCGDASPNRLGLDSGSGLPAEERDARRLAARAASRHRPRGGPGDPRRPTRDPIVDAPPHDGWRVRLPRGRRPRDLQRRRHPGGRDPGRQRHRRRAVAGPAVRRLRPPIDGLRAADARIRGRRARRALERPAAVRRHRTAGTAGARASLIASPPHTPLLGPRSFGHAGAGGELAFADDEPTGVGFAYVNNQMGGIPDDRARRLVEAVRGCLP